MAACARILHGTSTAWGGFGGYVVPITTSPQWAEGKLSKAAKKNQKRSAKKHGVPVKGPRKAVTPESLLRLLKEQLEIAKVDKDVKRASEIREQIWVLNDIVSGVKTDMPDSELKPIMAKIEALLLTKKKEHEPVPSLPAEPPNRIRNLQKKLRDIEKIKVRKLNGETLEKGQIEKLKSEGDVLLELQQMQAVVATTAEEASCDST